MVRDLFQYMAWYAHIVTILWWWSVSCFEYFFDKVYGVRPNCIIHNIALYAHVHVGLSLKFDGSDEVLVTSLPSVFMEREASEVRRGRPTVAPTILKVLFKNLLFQI